MLCRLMISACAVLALAVEADAQVHEQWMKTFDAAPTGPDDVDAVAVAASGNVYVAGHTGPYDVLLLKYDSLGSLLWSRTFALGPHFDISHDMVIDPVDERISVVGRGDDPMTTCALALQFDSSGNLLWFNSLSYQTLSGSQFYHATLKSNRHLVATGATPPGI